MATSSTLGLLFEISADPSKATAAVQASSAEITSALAGIEAASTQGAGQIAYSHREAREAIRGVGEELGVHMPRFVSSYLTSLAPVGGLMASAFSAVAVVGLIEVIANIGKEVVKLADEYKGFDKESVKAWDDARKGAQDAELVLLSYEHYSGAAAAGQPVPPDWLHAAGWIERPDKIEDFTGGQKMLWAWAEFTPRCLAAIRAKELRYFSPELSWTGTNEHGESVGTKLNAGAILIRPFLLDLPPIEISASDYPKLLETVSLSESKRVSFRQREGKMQNVEQGKTVSATEELNRGVTLLMSETGLPYDRALSRYARKNPEVYERSKTEVLQGSEFVGAEKVSLGRTGTVSAQEELHRGVTALMSEKQLPYDKALSEFSRKHPAVWYRHLAESTQG